MKENLTELVFLLDRSGSMAGLEKDTIGGYNSLLEKQKKEGEAIVTTILFDDKYEVLHNGVDINKIEHLNSKDYFVRGSTALLDAIGKTINEVGAKINKLDESEHPSSVIMVITTDGYENASREYNLEKIQKMIKHQKEKYSWKFLFVGANIDAISTAESFGIDKQFASNYTATSRGTEKCFNSLSTACSMLRSKTCAFSEEWKKNLE